uniref:B box-type domain-containing protein n=1 Tax=Castor canadensis TaxID=51338 RepID=A0A8C0XML0_CASCN
MWHSFMSLHLFVFPEYSAQESGIDTSAVSSRESKPKNLKELDGQEGDGQRQSSNGAVDMQSSQPEAGRGPQKKCQSKRRDQKVPEDTQSKLWARGTVAISRRGPLTTQMPGDKDSRVSAQLRRNASSAGRLQGLCNVALGRRESKKFEVYLPSGKKRPKSLEIPISSGEGELPNPETFLIAEQSRNANSDSAATPRVALEKGSRNPEHSVVLQELAFGSTPSNAPLPGEKKCTASWEESGTGEPETPEALGKVAGGICHKPSNPELLSSSGRPQDEAACHLCHTQEGSPRCSQCQASLAKNSSRGLSPQPVPHCQRHLKQMQLLFCEDHGEAICLICRLSQEHRGHWVRPIQEAAIEYKVGAPCLGTLPCHILGCTGPCVISPATL